MIQALNHAINSYYTRETVVGIAVGAAVTNNRLVGAVAALATVIAEVALITLSGGTREYPQLIGLLVCKAICVLATVGIAKVFARQDSDIVKKAQYCAVCSSLAIVVLRIVFFNQSSNLFPPSLPFKV